MKFLRAPFFAEHLHQWLLLKVSGFQPPTLLKKRLRNRCFAVNLAKFLRTSFLLTEHLRMTASCVYLWILRLFSEHFFYTAILGISCRILTTRYSKKLFHRCFSSILYQIEKYPFEGTHLLKIPENYLWRSYEVVMKLQDAQRLVPTCKLTKKTISHIFLHAFCVHFLRIHQNYFFRRGFESLRAQFLSGNVSGK